MFNIVFLSYRLPFKFLSIFVFQVILWHRSCYSAYTSARNLLFQEELSFERHHIDPQSEENEQENNYCKLRSPETCTNWELCLICQQKKCKGEINTLLVSIERRKQVHERIMKASNIRQEEIILRRISGQDLVACEARYHAGCYKRYTAVTSSQKHTINLNQLTSNEVYNAAFEDLIHVFENKIFVEEKAYNTAYLLQCYKDFLVKQGLEDVAATSYKMQNLKVRLQRYYGDKLIFYQRLSKKEGETVFSSDINLSQIINNNYEKQKEIEEIKKQVQQQANDSLQETVKEIRDDMSNIEGVNIYPLDINDITLEKVKSIVPEKLQRFIHSLIMTGRQCEKDSSDVNYSELKCLSICQDIISAFSQGAKKMPKQLGLALTIKSMYRGKEITRMLNKLGHCSNYWEASEIDTKWAQDILDNNEDFNGYYQATVPSNIISGYFVQAAADNSNYLLETLTGKASVDIMSISYFQPQVRAINISNNTLPSQKHTKKQRSLQQKDTKLYELKVNFGNAQPDFVKKVSKEILDNSLIETEYFRKLNTTWRFLRNSNTEIFDADTDKIAPGWSGFHTLVSTTMSIPCAIGYAPFIPFSVKDPNTVYTCMKTIVQAFKLKIQQANPVLTFDEDLYAIAKKIQWATTPELDDIVVRLGGLLLFIPLQEIY